MMIYYAKLGDTGAIIELYSGPESGLIKIETELGMFDLLGAIVDGSGSVTEVVKVPQSVTMRQAKRALYDAGLLESVDAEIRKAGGKMLIDWEYSNAFERQNPTLDAMAAKFKLTEKQLDDLFIKAAKESL